MNEEKDKNAYGIETGGGSQVAGNVEITDGDFAGRDEIVYGDKVRGNKVHGNQINAQIGENAQNIVIGSPTAKYIIQAGSIKISVYLVIMVVVGVILVAIVVLVSASWTSISKEQTSRVLEILTKPTPTATAMPTPSQMIGDFRVAVATFLVTNSTKDAQIANELSEGIYLNIQKEFNEQNLGFTITVWNPERVGAIQGSNNEEQTTSAQELAMKLGADIVVYGVIDTYGKNWRVQPKFFVSLNNFYEAQEIVGEYELGQSIQLPSQNDIASRIILSSEVSERIRALSKIAIGLAYYSIQDYDKSLKMFKSAERIFKGELQQGRNILYLLMGNASIKNEDIAAAKEYYEKSMSIDPSYARPYIGLGGVYYLLALKQFSETHDSRRIDLHLLELSIGMFEMALRVEKQPVLADIASKAHFGIGQCYLMLAYAGKEDMKAKAIDEFLSVINEYRRTGNSRIQEITSESHARLALIYAMSKEYIQASQHYQSAALLLKYDSEKQYLYLERAKQLQAKIRLSVP